MTSDKDYRDLLEAATQGKLTRRTVLKRAAALGLATPAIAALLAACGSSGSSSSSTATTGTGSGGSTATSTSTSTSTTTTSTGTPSASGGTPSATSTTMAASPGKRGGSGALNLLWWQAAVILNPHLASGTTDFDDARICLEPLADFDDNGNLVPMLSDDTVPSLDNGMVAKDGTGVTWKLRQGVKWHDGQPFTADDVVFTFQYVTNPDTAATTLSSYLNVDKVEKVDDYTVKLTFKKPDPAWYRAFTGGNGTIVPKHVLQNYVGKNAKNAPFNLKPVGTGPYMVNTFKPGDTSVYNLFPNYWRENTPHFDTVTKKGGGDATSAARAVFQTQESDYAWNLQIAPNVLNAMKSDKATLLTVPGGGTERLMINHSDPNTTTNGQKSYYQTPHPHFKVLQVRQALALLCDRNTIATQLYGPGGKATAFTDNSQEKYQPKDVTFEYNVDKAKSMLDAAGAKPGSGGIRVLNGRPMKWTYQTTVNQVRQQNQEIVKASAEKAGISMTLKSIDSGVYFSADAGNTDTSGHFYADLEMYTNGAGIWPLDWYTRYYSDQPARDICQQSNGWNAGNDLRYQNPDFNKMFDQVTTELDTAKQESLFQQMQKLVVTDVAEIGLVNRFSVSARVNTITGDTTSRWASELWMLREWDRKKA